MQAPLPEVSLFHELLGFRLSRPVALRHPASVNPARLFHLVLLLIGLLSTLPAEAGLFTSRTTREYRRLREAAAQAGAAGDQTSQQKHLEAALERISRRPGNPFRKEALLALGRFHLVRGEPWTAATYLQQAGSKTARFLQARALMALYRFDEADRLLTWVDRLNPGSAPATVLRGRLRLQQNKPAEALALLEAGLGRLDGQKTAPSGETSGELPRPTAEELVGVIIDRAIALQSLNREEEAEATLADARKRLAHLKHPMPEYFVLRHASEQAEAMGDLSRAHRLLYQAATAAYRNRTARPEQRREANFSVLGFHIRQGQNTPASTQESILMQQGLTLDDLDPFNDRQIRLREERLLARDAAEGTARAR